LINDYQEQHIPPLFSEEDESAAKELEYKIMDLNKRAMEHLGREQLYGYGTIDETQWQE
jgi:hypothetical protein